MAIGLHALLDAPTLLFAGSDGAALVALAGMALALIVWPRLAAFGSDRHGPGNGPAGDATA